MTHTSKIKVVDVPLGEIIQDLEFRQELGDIAGLAKQIADQGLLQPIMLNTAKKVVFGRRRLEAVKSLGWPTIPAIIRVDAEELPEREAELIENLARKDHTWWERAQLEERIFRLKKEKNPDWSNREQAEYLGESHTSVNRQRELAAAIEVVPDLKEADNASQAWKVYSRLKEDVVLSAMKAKAKADISDKVGEAKSGVKVKSKYLAIAEKGYVVGDTITALQKHRPGSMHFAEVDPPYGVELNKRKSRNVNDNAVLYQEVDAKVYPQFLLQTALGTYNALAEDAFCVWWFGPTWDREVRDVLREVGFAVSDVYAVWTKGTAGQTASPDTHLGNACEFFYYARKGSPKLAKPGRSNEFAFKPVPPSQKIHPTEKPLELMQEIVDTFCYPGQRILVPFLGSGVTLRAAFSRGCTGWGWDLEEINKGRFEGRVAEDVEKGIY